MSRRPSPRPEYDRATAIGYDQAALHLWGDEESGYVGDRIYVSSSLIHLIEFSLRPRARFTHSEDNRTIFAADEVLHVTEGEMLLVNPETGEAILAREGESVFFRRDTWHHAVNRSNDRPLRVMELFAPPPSTGASSAYARTQPYLSDWRYGDDRWLGRWPMDRAEREKTRSFHLVREPDLLWRADHPEDDLLVGLVCSTEHLTAGRARLLPGQSSLVRRHGGDLTFVVLSGEIAVFLPEAPEPPSWFELGVGDGFYVPRGDRYQLFGHSSASEVLFGVAPTYLPGEG
ncbi:MAG: cupin domain-containing protein [bacterium]|nr:cupin domain-containing protein [bacterium]